MNEQPIGFITVRADGVVVVYIAYDYEAGKWEDVTWVSGSGETALRARLAEAGLQKLYDKTQERVLRTCLAAKKVTLKDEHEYQPTDNSCRQCSGSGYTSGKDSGDQVHCFACWGGKRMSDYVR